ncbi:MAG: N-glycosylase/DNA lyase [Candidatus Pacearchaeota archaeon]
MELINQINELRKSEISKIVETRLSEFSGFKNKSDEDWFSELCFCLLTANSRARTAINIQNELKGAGFLNLEEERIAFAIKRNHHRFHNHKAKYICEARKFQYIKNILSKLKSESEKRNFIVENVKGLGMKEASHFLRNTGSNNLAILDRHILNLMLENKLISEVPKPITKNKYLEIEKEFFKLASQLNMSPAELDLYMWYMKTGEVMK